MSRFALFSAAAAFLLLALPAAAHTSSSHWGDRASPRDPAMSVIDKKLEHGARSGALNKKELKHLRAERGKLMSMKRRAMLDGVLTRGEYKRVHREELQLIKAIDQASAGKPQRKKQARMTKNSRQARSANKVSRTAPLQPALRR